MSTNQTAMTKTAKEKKRSKRRPRVRVERQADLGELEAFRLDGDDDARIAMIALKPDLASGRVEFGVWRDIFDEDARTAQLDCSASGKVELSAREWTDATREDAIRQVVYRYEEDLGVLETDLVFFIEAAPDYDDEPEE